MNQGDLAMNLLQADLIDLIQKSISDYLYLADQHKIKIYFRTTYRWIGAF